MGSGSLLAEFSVPAFGFGRACAALQRGLGTTSPKRSSKGWYHTPCLLQPPDSNTQLIRKDQTQQLKSEQKNRRTHINDKKLQEHSQSTTNHIPHFGMHHILSNDKRSGNQRDGQSSRRTRPIGRGSPKRKRKPEGTRRSERQC